MNNLSNFDFDKLNSLTKYPSILTYHELGDKGKLQDALCEGKSFTDRYFISEKIHGTNARILFFNDDYMIGSREEILYAKGDRVVNPQSGIVNVLKPIADKLLAASFMDGESDTLAVLFGEVYGGNINDFKQYSLTKSFSARFFDTFKMQSAEIESVISMKREQISSWRENGGQKFLNDSELHNFCMLNELRRVPILESSVPLPTSLNETYEYLKQFSDSNAVIDAGHKGRSEGVVVRTFDRSLIRKLRFEDYERTLQSKKQ